MARVSHVRISASEQREPLITPQELLSDLDAECYSEDDLSDGITFYGIITDSSDHFTKGVNLLTHSSMMSMRGAWLCLKKA